jgi:hypothetical protein
LPDRLTKPSICLDSNSTPSSPFGNAGPSADLDIGRLVGFAGSLVELLEREFRNDDLGGHGAWLGYIIKA